MKALQNKGLRGVLMRCNMAVWKPVPYIYVFEMESAL